MADEEIKCPPCNEGAPEYMLTYGDMMTLLLCFFVLLLSMSTMDAKKFEVAAASFQQALNGVLTSMPTVAIHKEVMRPLLGGTQQNKHMAADAAMKIREVAAKENLEDAIKVEVTDAGIAVKISDPVGFDIGSDNLKPSFANVLNGMLDAIKNIPERDIRVEGHTDNVPINSPRFPSNWELSAARALSVVKFLYKNGEDPAKLSAVGYGEFRPISPNNTVKSRQKNRRIEVFIEFLEKKEE
jgi:chemotaxis protein MotB